MWEAGCVSVLLQAITTSLLLVVFWQHVSRGLEEIWDDSSLSEHCFSCLSLLCLVSAIFKGRILTASRSDLSWKCSLALPTAPLVSSPPSGLFCGFCFFLCLFLVCLVALCQWAPSWPSTRPCASLTSKFILLCYVSKMPLGNYSSYISACFCAFDLLQYSSRVLVCKSF